MAEKMSIKEALGVLTPFKNLFRAAERIEEALSTVTTLEAETSRLKREKAEADDARAVAVRDLEAIRNKVKQAEIDRLETIQDIQKEIADKKAGLAGFKAQCLKETGDFRALEMKERQKIRDDTLALEAKRSDLAKTVREMAKPPGEPEGTAQARVEP
jgi:hypothetical protein